MEQEGRRLTAAEAAEYGEFVRSRREAEVALTLKKLVIDAVSGEADGAALRRACETALRLHAEGIVVSPVCIARAKRCLGTDSAPRVIAVVGGTGGSVLSVKRAEARKAVRQGAREVRLVLWRGALAEENFSYLKREIRGVRRAAKRATLIVQLTERGLSEAEIALGVRAACAAHADGICVRGELPLLLCAVEHGAGKLSCDATEAENAEQLKMLLRAGAARVCTDRGEKIAGELYACLNAEEES